MYSPDHDFGKFFQIKNLNAVLTSYWNRHACTHKYHESNAVSIFYDSELDFQSRSHLQIFCVILIWNRDVGFSFNLFQLTDTCYREDVHCQ